MPFRNETVFLCFSSDSIAVILFNPSKKLQPLSGQRVGFILGEDTSSESIGINVIFVSLLKIKLPHVRVIVEWVAEKKTWRKPLLCGKEWISIMKKKMTRGWILQNEKGVALISVYMVSMVLATISGVTFAKSFYEARQVQREIGRIRTYAAAEAGIQNALAQISVNAYTGFINTNPINQVNFQDVNGLTVGSYSVNIQYPNQADWVIVQSQSTVDGDTRELEGRVFLDSNLSKYLVYANTTSFSSGNNAQYGSANGTDPDGVSSNENDRAALYFTGNYQTSGSNIQIYGDLHANDEINGDNTSRVHGDTYSGHFLTNAAGVVNDGITGGLVIGDGFVDDLDRNHDGSINPQDGLDRHALTDAGGGDSHARETLVQINHNFYATHNNTPFFVGSADKSRYLKFEPNAGVPGTTTILEYDSASFSNLVGSYALPANAVVYVKGDAYVKGQIDGRVSVVASDDIVFDGNVSYVGGQSYVDPNHSAAFLAKDTLYFRENNLEVSGILYAENSSNSSAAFNSTYNLNWQNDPGSKVRLRLYGNRVMNGSTNLSYYEDRVYAYDPMLKYYRPPGIPVVPALRLVREKTPSPVAGG